MYYIQENLCSQEPVVPFTCQLQVFKVFFRDIAHSTNSRRYGKVVTGVDCKIR